MILALNIVLSQFGWFASVVGAANNLPWAGPAIVALVVAWHLHVAHRPATELQLIIVCSALGAIFDSLLVTLGWLRYPSGMLVPWLAPYWIVAMWALFATTLNISFRWLRGRPLLAAIIGAVAGPLSYLAGAKLGGVRFVDPAAAQGALAVGWALMLPVLVALACRLDGMARRPRRLAEAV
ncbi:MAG TPA: DUF2878 domain-containing protein [Woeseiaceae bacterium]|nr:DUF2878 domain-containing protein [Woeseiaceae bacterium]